MVSQLAEEFYKTGQGWSFIIVTVIASILLLTQLGWMFYRWVCDAKTEWGMESSNKAIFCGGINWPMKMKEFDAKAFIALIAVIWAITSVLTLIWPAMAIIGTVYAFGYIARGCLRFKRKVNRTIGGKADKEHHHDAKYERITEQ